MAVIYSLSTTTEDGQLSPSTTAKPQNNTKLWWRLDSGTAKVKAAWYAVQLSHRGGKYSIERMLSLEEYTRQTSLLRVLLVCVCTPLPMITLALLQECIPLQDPSGGWRSNYGFWVRVSILGGMVAFGMVAQTEYLLTSVTFSTRQFVSIFVYQSLVYPALAMFVAEFWAFPIPFIGISLNLPFLVLFLCGFRVVAGKYVIQQLLANRERFVRHVNFVSAQLVMSIIYPAYQVVFNLALDSHFEIPVLLLLPCLKLAMKNFLLRTITHLEDMMPEGTIFTVDFFNALYLVSSMQSSSSIITVSFIIILDFAQTIVQLRGLNKTTSTIVRRLREAAGATKNDGNLLHMIVLLCSSTSTFDKQNRASIQMRSCLRHKLSASARNLLDSLDGRPRINRSPIVVSPDPAKLRAKSLDWKFAHRVVHPVPVASAPKKREQELRAATIAEPVFNLQVLQILHETLEMLFTAECIILTEYLESIIPLIYASYVLIMVHLPSAVYHTELEGITVGNVGSTVTSVLVYALLELGSFALLTGILHRNCGVRALYHLAFVLETQMTLIQAKLIVWMLMTIAFRMVHFGFDFSFQFAWYQILLGGETMDELASVGIGLALGLVVVSVLTLYPGDPFDYTTDCADNCNNEHLPSTTANTTSKNDQLTSLKTPLADAIGEKQEQQIAAIEQAAQRVKIQKLQELLGMEQEKAEQLVQRAKEEAVGAVTDGQSSSTSHSTGSKSAWLDRGFFVVMFGLLAWVLWQDYSINLLSVAAHMFPREAEIVQQVLAAPRGLRAWAVALWR